MPKAPAATGSLVVEIVRLLAKRDLLPEDAGFELLEAYGEYEQHVAKAMRGKYPSERWAIDREEGQSVVDFLRAYWGDLIKHKRVRRSDLLQADPELYQAWNNWLRTHRAPSDLVIPKKFEQLEQRFDARGERVMRAYKNAMFLSNRYQRLISIKRARKSTKSSGGRSAAA